jgi:SAM-dependent methyltransferase
VNHLQWISPVIDRGLALVFRTVENRLGGAFSIYLDKQLANDHGTPECDFLASDGRRIPVFRAYRYSVKAGWQYFSSLNILSGLRSRECLLPAESEFFEKSIGSRTIETDPAAAEEVARQASARVPSLFIPGSRNDAGLSEFVPDRSQLKATLAVFRRRHASMFSKLAAAGVYSVPQQGSILEIGYTTGGHSIFAFEQLGYRAFGIDNYYGGLVDHVSLPMHLKSILGSEAGLLVGDVTKTTQISSESLDVVFSASVLEHIQDLKGAFEEMYRVLKPGGAMIHNYAPYFSHDGGHALGIGDSPWVHVRLSESDYLRYIAELRPNEQHVAHEWIAGALHRDVPQWKMQRLVSATGFRIRMWMAKPSPLRFLRDLSPQIIEDCFANTPDIGIEDLVSRSVSFVAVK